MTGYPKLLIELSPITSRVKFDSLLWNILSHLDMWMVTILKSWKFKNPKILVHWQFMKSDCCWCCCFSICSNNSVTVILNAEQRFLSTDFSMFHLLPGCNQALEDSVLPTHVSFHHPCYWANAVPFGQVMFLMSIALWSCLWFLESSNRSQDWMKHRLESKLPGQISITSDMQMTPPLWQKMKKN